MKSTSGLLLGVCLILLCGSLASNAITFTNDASISAGNTNFEGSEIIVDNCTLTIDGTHTFANLLILNGGVVTHSSSADGMVTNLVTISGEEHTIGSSSPATLSQGNVVTSSIVVTDVSGEIVYTSELDYHVYSSSGFVTLSLLEGTAIPEDSTILVSYDIGGELVPAGMFLTITNNLEIEAGGAINLAKKGFGGGLGSGAGVSRTTFSTLVFTNGSGAGHGGFGGLSAGAAPGGNSYGSVTNPIALGSGGGTGSGFGGAGGGSGRIVVQNVLRVDGMINADGERGTNSHSGGGSGGSIWIDTKQFSGSGTVSANGGNGEPSNGGGGGGGRIAIFSQTNSFTGDIVARGGAGWKPGGAGTVYLHSTATPLLLMDNRGFFGTDTPNSLSGSYDYDLTVKGGASLVTTNLLLGSGHLWIESNSWIIAPSNQNLLINVSALTMQTNSGISADQKGFSSGQGTGFGNGSSSGSTGAGHGGFGGGGAGFTNELGGSSYGAIADPNTRGSGGGSINLTGGTGGGGIIIYAGTIILDGRITANAGAARGLNSGGGSGGFVIITGTSLSGNGLITADGGSGDLPYGGGGGGGRISIKVNNPLTNFFGQFSAKGGEGWRNGGAGTVYVSNFESIGANRLLVNNEGKRGVQTPVPFVGSYNLVIQGGAVVSNSYSSTSTLNSLSIGSNSVLLLGVGPSINRDATIEKGGEIIRSAVYSSQGAGTTSQNNGVTAGSGGGHGGMGGKSGNGAPGGIGFGSITAPFFAGGYGGNGSAAGGLGGGPLRLVVNGTLSIDGKISADGISALASNAGGGAGGSVYLTVGRLNGSGTISATGGSGKYQGGGGGGGRIAVHYGTNNFTGQMFANGGLGSMSGGAGTVYLKQNTAIAQLLVDNGGSAGAVTPFAYDIPCNLIVRNGTIVSNSASTTSPAFSSLHVTSNSWLHGLPTLNITNVTIEAGCGIIVDGMGPVSGYGAGSSLNGQGGGGGYGGVGGASGSSASGGGCHGSLSSPSSPGGPGGSGTTAGTSGLGGGRVSLNVNGTLTLNGLISLNGFPGNSNGGGGSGGGIALSLGRLTGAGTIRANGGNGALPGGGGGGGGRIGITLGTNSFTGTLSARGGSGANYGGAGTVYIKTNSISFAQITLENGDNKGGVTLLDQVSSSHDYVVGSGTIAGFGGTTISLRSITVKSNATLTMNGTSTASLTLSGSSVVIESGGHLDMDGRGYSSISSSPGLGGNTFTSLGYTGGGGGSGGMGGNSGGNAAGGSAFGFYTSPNYGGAGGGYPSSSTCTGGGIIQLNVGTLKVDGRVSANGRTVPISGYGGGAGGGISLTAGTFLGSGIIEAKGATGDYPYGGGGGGGRIAVVYTTNQFLGKMSATGGEGATHGGAGTIFLRANNSSIGNLFIANDGNRGAITPIPLLSSINTLSLSNGAVGSLTTFSLSVSNLLISSNSWLNSTNLATVFSINGNAWIEETSRLNFEGQGSAAGQGSGTVSSTSKGGAGHGGNGGWGTNMSAGISYGSIIQPQSLGSGAASTTSPYPAKGGGALRMTVNTLQLDGEINASGLSGAAADTGGGSGGSIWLTAGRIAGGGNLVANGGSGKPSTSGGGGGGRIALYYATNDFFGTIFARGGKGLNAGGAGTIYMKAGNLAEGALIVDNGGMTGADTPITLTNLVDFTTAQGASVVANNALILNNLTIFTNSALSGVNSPSNLDVTVFGRASIAGAMDLSGRGYGNSNAGPGAGTFSVSGSGGGHGGKGGDSANAAPGGTTYGSATEPTDAGSRGGGPVNFSAPSSSQGGGSIRLKVAGSLDVPGKISANGQEGIYDRYGGGAGGSIWITAGTLQGSGFITADGGNGEPEEAGGGGGGRIALYSKTNNFSGVVSANGGAGWEAGENGTLFISPILDLQVVSQSPTGTITTAVSQILLTFNSLLNYSTITPFDFSITTPQGPIVPTSVAASGMIGVRIYFPEQTEPGTYTIQAGPQIENIYGVPMTSSYTGEFVIALPTISGRVTDSNGVAVAGVTLQPSGEIAATATDENGDYQLTIPLSWSGTVTPSNGEFIFIPQSRSYTNVAAHVINHHFTQTDSDSLRISSQSSGTNLSLAIFGMSGVSYQVYHSTNLVNWMPYGSAISGSNALIEVQAGITNSPQTFFQFRLSR